MSVYDEWPPRQNYEPPLISSRWQRELNLIAGLAPNGMPHLRLEWGCTTTWTPQVKELKYLYHRQTRQTGWGVYVYDASGNIIKTLRYDLKANVPEPNKTYGCAFPINIDEEIGIPRFWIAQYTPPSLVGPWDESRLKTLSEIGSHADMGAFPHQGMYYLGFHGLWMHESGRVCCEKANQERRKCFGLYRPPSDLDILYCSQLWKKMKDDLHNHEWTESADDTTMYRVLKNLNNEREDQASKDRDEMKLRIRDAFKTHKAQFTSRKKKDTFVFTPYGAI